MNKRMSEEQLRKLPKWAQDRVRTLERDNETLREEIKAVTEGQGETNVYFAHGSIQRGLPKNSRIVFEVNGTEITLDVWNGQLRVYTHGDGLLVQGGASNHIIIKPGSFDR